MLGRKVQVVEQADREAGPGAVKPPKTTAGRRAVSMPLAVVEALAAHALLRRQEANGGYEFLSATAGEDRAPLHVVAEGEAATERKPQARGLVFTASGGAPLDIDNFRARAWGPAVKAAGLEPLRIHDMRHTAASLATKGGADVKVIQRMLGRRRPR